MTLAPAAAAKNIKSVTVNNTLVPLAFSVLSGVLYAFSFPPFNLSWLAWFCLVPLLYFSDDSVKKNIQRGFLCGLTANLIIFFWLWKTFQAADVGFPTTFSAWTALSVVLSLYFSFFLALYGRLPNHPAKPWIAAALWISLDHIRTHLFTGFPWALLGHTQASFLSFIQLVSLTGVEGLTFFLVASNAVLADLLKKPRESFRQVNGACLVGLVLVIVFWGHQRLKTSQQNSAPSFRVALLQGNIDQYQKWDAQYEADIRRTYAQLSEDAAKQNPDLIVWPESAVPGWFPDQKKYRDWIKTVVTKTNTRHLVGAVTSRKGGDYNAAFLLSQDGLIKNEYNKQHLVPFGEYIPYGKFLKNWVPFLGQMGIFAPGDHFALFPLNDFNLAPNICYEAIFPGLVRKSVLIGADVIVNITNDGWYLDTGAPQQHFVTNIFRAIENGRPVIRAANTGISAVIDSFGRPLLQTSLLTQGAFVTDVPVFKQQTLFLLLGPWFQYLAWLCLLIFPFLYTRFHVTRTRRKD